MALWHVGCTPTQEAPSPWRKRRSGISPGMCEEATGRGRACLDDVVQGRGLACEACVTRGESSCSVRSPRPFVRALTFTCDGTWPRVMVHTRRERRVTAPDAPRHIYPRQPRIPEKRWLGIFLDRYHPEKTSRNEHI